MKITKKLLSLMLIAAFIASLAGCSSVSVNTEKDNASVVAVINGENILKESYKNYLTFDYILYKINDQTLPTTDADIKDFKKTMFNDYINYLLYRNEAQEIGLAADDAKVAAAVDELMARAKAAFPDQEDYDNLFAQYGTTEAAYRVNAFEQLRLIEYYNLYSDNQKDFSIVTEATALTVDGKAIPNYIFYYYVITQELDNYVNKSTYPQNEEDLYKIFDEAMTNLTHAQAYIANAEKTGVVISDEEISSAMSYVNAIENYIGAESMGYLQQNYLMSDEQWALAKAYMGKALAAQSKIESNTIAAINPTDSELKNYYNKNKNSFDTSTVKAYHILTKDKTFAKQLSDEAGGTAEGFMAVYQKYQSDSRISEAADLGEFRQVGYDKDFWNTASSMKVGEAKGMVKTQYGYHLIYVYGSNKVDLPAFDDIKDDIKTNYVASVKEAKIESALKKIYKDVMVKKGDYKKLPSTALVDLLKEKYGVKTYENRAVR